MGKKVTVLDELKIPGGGIYAIMPYDRLDKHGKGCFKVGLAIEFRNRMESYHTCFPAGMYLTAFLQDPRANRTVIRAGKKIRLSIKQYYLKIEIFVFDSLVKYGAKRLDSTTRIQTKNKLDGNTEWFYTDEETIFKAIDDAHLQFGGISHQFHLGDVEKDYQQKIKNTRNKPVFVGEIIQPLYKLKFV